MFSVAPEAGNGTPSSSPSPASPHNVISCIPVVGGEAQAGAVAPGETTAIVDFETVVTHWGKPQATVYVGATSPAVRKITEGSNEDAAVRQETAVEPGGSASRPVQLPNMPAEQLATTARVPLGKPVVLGTGGTTSGLTGNIQDNAALVFNRSDSPTFSGAISGAGGVTQAGRGILLLFGTNTYSGGTTINAGTLKLKDSASLPSGMAAAVNGTLDRSAFGAAVSTLTGTGTVNHSGAGNNTLSVDSGTFAGTIENTGGTLALLKTGSGQLILSGIDRYTGGTTISDGSLIVTSNSALAGRTSRTVAASGTFLFDPSQAASPVAVSSRAAAVPEPSTFVLLGAGVLTVIALRTRRNRSRYNTEHCLILKQSILGKQ